MNFAIFLFNSRVEQNYVMGVTATITHMYYVSVTCWTFISDVLVTMMEKYLTSLIQHQRGATLVKDSRMFRCSYIHDAVRALILPINQTFQQQ